jgi:hypothetical protein
MFCSNCGKELTQEMRFCANCGTAVNVSIVPDNSTEAIGGVTPDKQAIQRKKNPVKVLAIAAAVILVLAILYLSILFSGGNVLVSDDVYVCGLADEKAVYWKNGELVELPGITSRANSIYVSGNDVYVCGSVDRKAVYWKNGELVALSDRWGSKVNSIYVSGDDVYAGGNGTLWKNGEIMTLSGTGETFSIEEVFVVKK